MTQIFWKGIPEFLFGEISSQQWSAHQIVANLGLVSQVIRYSRPMELTGPSAAPLADFLSSVWEHLDSMVTISLRTETVGTIASMMLDAVYSVYENATTALPHIFMKGDVLLEMLNKCVLGFDARHSASSIKCVAAIVSALCFQSGQEERDEFQETNELLGNLLIQVLGVMNISLQSTGLYESGEVQPCSWEWAEEPEAIEQLYMYIHLYFTMCPQVIISVCETSVGEGGADGQNKTLAHILMELSLVCLGQSKERDVVRRILQVMQSMWYPLVGGDHVKNCRFHVYAPAIFNNIQVYSSKILHSNGIEIVN